MSQMKMARILAFWLLKKLDYFFECPNYNTFPPSEVNHYNFYHHRKWLFLKFVVLLCITLCLASFYQCLWDLATLLPMLFFIVWYSTIELNHNLTIPLEVFALFPPNWLWQLVLLWTVMLCMCIYHIGYKLRGKITRSRVILCPTKEKLL